MLQPQSPRAGHKPALPGRGASRGSRLPNIGIYNNEKYCYDGWPEFQPHARQRADKRTRNAAGVEVMR